MHLSDRTLAFGEEFATALLGLDALYAAEAGKGTHGAGGDIERLVVLNMSTTHEPEPFSGYDEASGRFSELQAKAAELVEPDRALYYRQAASSGVAFARWRTEGLGFADQIRDFLHLAPEPASESELDELRARMHALLTELGYTGDLPDQSAQWEARQRVPAPEVKGVLTVLLSEAWDLTAERIGIPAEKSDAMQVETVSSAPYNAMCDFGQRLIRINTDPTLTMPVLRHLAVHEGYPGHYLQFKRREIAYQEGRGAADNLLSVVNTASSAPFEGIADAGMQIIGWGDSLDDKLSACTSRYRAAVGTQAAWRLHELKWTPEAVREALLKDGLTGGEGWVDARMRFISANDRAALIWSYWCGEPSVNSVWQMVREQPTKLTDYVEYIYDRMHSVDSLQLFSA